MRMTSLRMCDWEMLVTPQVRLRSRLQEESKVAINHPQKSSFVSIIKDAASMDPYFGPYFGNESPSLPLRGPFRQQSQGLEPLAIPRLLASGHVSFEDESVQLDEPFPKRSTPKRGRNPHSFALRWASRNHVETLKWRESVAPTHQEWDIPLYCAEIEQETTS